MAEASRGEYGLSFEGVEFDKILLDDPEYYVPVQYDNFLLRRVG